MTPRVVKKIFTPQDQKRLNPVFLTVIVLVLAGCSYSGDKPFSLAPPPPAFDSAATEENAGVPALMAFAPQGAPLPSGIAMDIPEERVELKASLKEKGCSLRDRFDNKSTLAYQWGQGGQNRMELNVKGDAGFGGVGIDQVKLTYRLRLQPEKSRKEKCRYQSEWQGLIGSGYNEMLLRENDTMWERLNAIRNDVEDSVDKVF